MKDVKWYRGVDDNSKVPAACFTAENGEILAEHFGLEYIPQLGQLFFPGKADGAEVGSWVVGHPDYTTYFMYDRMFRLCYRPIEEHPFIPTYYINNEPDFLSECGVCRSEYAQPYHRDPIPGERVRCYDGMTVEFGESSISKKE